MTVFAASDEIADEALDVVYSLNVPEHIQDDRGVARTLIAKVRPGGTVLVYVPAFTLLYSSMDAKVGHVRRYRRAELVRLLESVGLQVRRSRYCDPLGFLAALLFRILGNDRGDLDPRMVRVFDRLVFPVSRLLEPLTGPFVGKNVLVVATKPRT